MRPKRKSPEIVLRDGKPAAVILDIAEDKETVERLEDVEDLKALKEMQKKPLKFRRLGDFLKEYRRSENDWRVPVGDYRIVYEIDAAASTVKVMRVRHRREVDR